MNSPRLERIHNEIENLATAWRRMSVAEEAYLYEDSPTDDGMTIRDRRGYAERQYRLDAGTTEVLRACSRPVAVRELQALRLSREL